MGGGGASGSSGVPSNTSGQAVTYQPTAQPQSDTLYQALLGGLGGALSPPLANAFGSLPGVSSFGTNIPNAFSSTPGGVSYGLGQPFVGGVGSGTITDPNNPDYLEALGGALQTATGGQNLSDLAVWLTGGNSLLQGALGSSLGAAGTTANNAYDLASQLGSWSDISFLPQLQNALGSQANINTNAAQLSNFINGTLPSTATWGLQEGNAIQNYTNAALATNQPLAQQYGSNLGNYANSILNTAFDPQSALYNQLQNQVSQQAAAANASAGLGGSAYGASTTANALSNFDINWQNQQLARQAQGLSSAAPAYSTATSLPFSPIAAASPQYAAAQSLETNPLVQGGAIQQQVAQLLNGATMMPGNVAGQFGNLGAQAGSLGSTAASLPYLPLTGALTTAGDIGSLLGTANTLQGLPYNTQSGNTSNALQALGSMTNLGNQQFTIPQQLANDLQSYLQLGQAASGLSGQLGALGLNEQQSSLAGIGSALGTGSNLLFGTQGLSGALGLGSGGLLGGLGGGTSAATASSLADIGAIGGAGGGAIDSGVLAAAPAASSGGGFLSGSAPFAFA